MKFSKFVKEELTVFIKVKIDNLNEFTNVIPLKLSNEVNTNKDKINIIIVKKHNRIEYFLVWHCTTTGHHSTHQNSP